MLKELLYLTLLILLISALLALPLVKVPVSASARGIIRPIDENSQLTAVVSGRLTHISMIRNNQLVNRGDTLAIITTKQLDVQKKLHMSLLSGYREQYDELDELLAGGNNLRTDQYKKELSAMNEKVAQIQAELVLATKELNRAQILYEQKVIPAAEYETALHRHQGLSTQIAVVMEQQKAHWYGQKREMERQIRSLSAEIERLDQEQQNYIIIAPINGRIVNFSGANKDNFVVQGQILGEISPEDSLIAECLVPPKDIGFISAGQVVKFQIDSYNYNQWGLLEGNVLEIDRNMQVNQRAGEVYFRVLCCMNESFLELKNCYRGEVIKGMTFTARFQILDRSLWQLLFDRVDDWFNPKLK